MSRYTKGFNLLELSKDTWVFQAVDGESYVGSLKSVIRFAVVEHFFKLKEIETALLEMSKENHNAAHFGMWGTFIHSFNRERPKKNRANQ
jgi:hypothetical protein